MAEYRFITRWHIAAPIDRVWDTLTRFEDWHRWWKAVQSIVELETGEPDGVGKVQRYVWKMPLSYTIAFNSRVTQIQAPVRIEAVASGDVEGQGLWELSPTDRGTEICYTWTVRTTKPWMNLLAGIARPLLEWNHNAVMQQGGKGLAEWLQVELLEMNSVEQSKSLSTAVR